MLGGILALFQNGTLCIGMAMQRFLVMQLADNCSYATLQSLRRCCARSLNTFRLAVCTLARRNCSKYLLWMTLHWNQVIH